MRADAIEAMPRVKQLVVFWLSVLQVVFGTLSLVYSSSSPGWAIAGGAFVVAEGDYMAGRYSRSLFG